MYQFFMASMAIYFHSLLANAHYMTPRGDNTFTKHLDRTLISKEARQGNAIGGS